MSTPISTTRQRIRQNLGRCLRAARAFAGVTQAGSAAALEVTRNTVGSWERGEREPGAVDLLALATLYGVSLDALCGRVRPSHCCDELRDSSIAPSLPASINPATWS